MSHEKLIEALREEAKILDAGLASRPAPAWQASLRDALKGIADRLEGVGPKPQAVSRPPTGGREECITTPTEPPAIPSLSPDDLLDIRGRVSCATPVPPNDGFTMTRVVTTPQGTPTNAAAAAAGLPSPGSRLKDSPEWELSRIRIDSTHDPLKWVAHLTYHNVGMAPEGQQREVD